MNADANGRNQTDFLDERGSEKRYLGADEWAALRVAHNRGVFCMAMDWGTRAPRFCGLPAGHVSPLPGGTTHVMFSPLSLVEMRAPFDPFPFFARVE